MLAAILFLLLEVDSVAAQTRPLPFLTDSPPSLTRPLSPYPVYESPAFSRAVRAGTRTRTGHPGPRYWQQYARYRIQARFDPDANRLVGQQTVMYHNHSPDTLQRIAVHLRQNLFAGRPRGGVSLHRVQVDDTALSRVSSSGQAGYMLDGTVAWLQLPSPLLPSDSVSLSFEWSHSPPSVPADGRQGHEDGVYFFGYWYPQIAVYDDVSGWVAEPYTGQSEFYMGQADYDVHLTVPRHWLVGATGILQNSETVLTERTRERLETARRTGRVVSLLDARERGTGAATQADGPTATWHFTAESVRDFAWGTSNRYLWEATRALVPPPTDRFSEDGPSVASVTSSAPDSSRTTTPQDTVLIHSFYRPSQAAQAWSEGSARYTRNAVEVLSRLLRPYPYPAMTAMEGVLQSGGMEYPMVTIMQPWADTLKLAGDLMHEVGHMWVPMEVGTDEKRHVWMDEGLTQFNTAQGMRLIYGPEPRAGRPNDSEMGQRRSYLRAARQNREVPLMRHGDELPRSLYFVLPYNKGAQVLSALRGVLGRETFWRAYRTFLDRWWGKHPQPYDFFNTVADVANRDLTWFWHTWFYTTWTLDQAIASISEKGDSTSITIENRGRAPMPTPLAISRADGTTTHRTIPVDVWLEGADRHSVTVSRTPTIERIVIDPAEQFPDVDHSNQVWTR